MTANKTAAGADKPEREGGWIVWLVVVLLFALVGGGYAGSKYYVGDRVPRGVSISGVDVGGLARAEAQARLAEEFADRADRPIRVSVDGNRSAKLHPDQIGLEIDDEATLDEVGAISSWAPKRQWEFLVGGGNVEAVMSFEDRRLEARLAELSEGLGTPPKDGEVRFRNNGEIRVIEPAAGQAIDPTTARDALAAAYLSEEGTAELSVVPLQPEIDADDVRVAVETLAEPAVARPVTLEFGDAEIVLEPPQIARALRMVPEQGSLQLEVRRNRLIGMLQAATSDGEPVDATIRLNNGTPEVVPDRPGVSFDHDEAVDTFLRVVQGRGKARTGEVAAQVATADFTTKDAEALGVVEAVSEFTTYYPHSHYRNVNIGRAAELINGTLLKPGETFSMNGTVGERTAANGFTEGYIIRNGVLVQAQGGGVSQMATTLFNAMFFAGLEDVEHKPHSFYIDRYPVGREATVAWPSLDLRFRNDTKYGVLIQSYIVPSTPSSRGAVTVRMYSTKVWDIESTTGSRYAHTTPTTRYIQSSDCEAHRGWGGFQINVTRTFRKHGESAVHRTENFHTVYSPSDHVVCGPPPGQRNDDNGEDDQEEDT